MTKPTTPSLLDAARAAKPKLGRCACDFAATTVLQKDGRTSVACDECAQHAEANGWKRIDPADDPFAVQIETEQIRQNAAKFGTSEYWKRLRKENA